MRHSLTLLISILAVSLPWVHTEQQTKPAQPADLCVRPAAGPILADTKGQPAASSENDTPQMPLARVGRAAPNFEANAYTKGGFKPIKLSDYKGKWVVICFYPGDFTFV